MQKVSPLILETSPAIVLNWVRDTKDSQWSRSVWLNATLIYATNENKHAKIIQTFHTTICFPHCIAGRLAPQRSARSIFHGAPKTVAQDVSLCTHVVLLFFAAVIARNLGHQNYKTNILRQNDRIPIWTIFGICKLRRHQNFAKYLQLPRIARMCGNNAWLNGAYVAYPSQWKQVEDESGSRMLGNHGNPDLHLDLLLTAGVWAQQGSCEMNTSLDPQSLCN